MLRYTVLRAILSKSDETTSMLYSPLAESRASWKEATEVLGYDRLSGASSRLTHRCNRVIDSRRGLLAAVAARVFTRDGAHCCR